MLIKVIEFYKLSKSHFPLGSGVGENSKAAICSMTTSNLLQSTPPGVNMDMGKGYDCHSTVCYGTNSRVRVRTE